MRKLITITITVLFITGCATVPYDKTADGLLDTYIDTEFQSAILEFGPPNEVYSDGSDGRILHWETTTTSLRPGMTYSTSTGNVTANWNEILWSESGQTFILPPQTIHNTQFIQMYVNPAGEIYYHRHNTKSSEEIRIERQNERMPAYILGYGTIGLFLIALATGSI